ncbi:MAG TPA: permease-like cell division protein FtsX [Acidimicrobiales bacterium]|jgi:cell division transport system permease protein|nr:permease-like cell division protein FtsX [Acidimicrobiales bacterium]
MALSGGYVLRESAGNLRRNLFMTLAAILTMAVSLTAFGAVLVVRQGIHQASIQSEGGVEVAIFLSPTVSANQVTSIKSELTQDPGVKTSRYVDKADAWKEFQTIFQGNADIQNALTQNDMPPSFRLVPTRDQDIEALGNEYKSQPGVLRVSYPALAVKNLLNQARELRIGGYVLSAIVLVGAIALIVNTIQLAIFARRREVAVMKLVGATNWFIRLPFMLEGALQGLVGAIIGSVVIYFVRNSIAHLLQYETFLGTKLTISSHSAILDGILLLVFGLALGVAGSAFAIRRYLAV